MSDTARTPTGTVTCLFSDIEGSTRLELDLGTSAYGEVRERHRALLRAAFATHAGVEQGTEGDSFFVIFAGAPDAVAAAVDAQVSVGDIAGEGGAWGIAVLAAYTRDRAAGQSLSDYLASAGFAGAGLDTVDPDPVDVAGFDAYVQRFSAGLPIERAAVLHS